MTDTQYEDVRVQAVSYSGNWYTILREDGWFFSLSTEHTATVPAPQVGETVRLWGRGVGYPVRGIGVLRDGQVLAYWYETEEEYQARQQAAMQRTEMMQTYDVRIVKLPPLLRERMKHFRAIGGTEFLRHEEYELFVCEQATHIADTLSYADDPLDALFNFRNLSFAEQREMVQNLSEDHSGNTFIFSCMLAARLLLNQSCVSDYGALSPIVGSYRKDSLR